MYSRVITVTVEGLRPYFINMIGTLAVILVTAAFISGSELMRRYSGGMKNWKNSVIAGILGGLFGIYGTMTGIAYGDAIISVRDIGPMLAGFTGGPAGGLIAGLIAGTHRLLVGSRASAAAVEVTYACITATVCIGLMCGFLVRIFRRRHVKHWAAFLTGAVMEAFHLSLLLLFVKPFAAAAAIVKAIYLPFILVNAAGFTLLIAMIGYFDSQRAATIESSRLKTELEVANVIQRSLLPPLTEGYPARPELALAASMEPAKEVGGDFYDVFFVDRDRLAFVIADVSGKGIPAAMFMVSSKSLIQNCVRDFPSLAEAVTEVNNGLCRNNTAEMFVTAWIGVLHIPSGKLTFVNAGHNPPVLVSGGRASFIRSRGGLVLAGMEGVRYREDSLEMKKGDCLYLYTDGVTEAEDRGHGLFGEERLAACLERTAGMTPEEIVSGVRKAVSEHAGDFGQSDDITMLCVRYEGGGADA